MPLAKAQMDPSEEHRVGDEGGQRAAVPDVDVLAELMRAPDGRRAAVAAAEMRTVLQMRITVRFNTMGLWRLTKGMVIHIGELLLEYVTHRRVTKNHHGYKIERLHLVGGYKL